MNTSIKDDPKFNYFIQNRRLKPETIRRYTYELELYSESTSMKPEELIDEARKEQKEKEYMDERQLLPHLTNHINFMESKKYAPYRIKTSLKIIRSFYNQFEIILPKTPYKGEPSTFYLNVDELPGYEDIRKALTVSNIKYRAMITLMASSAMNIKDVRFLKVHEFIEAIKDGYKPRETGTNDSFHIPQRDEVDDETIGVWRRRREKTGVPHVTFSTPESIHLILDYLHQYQPESMDDYLFRSQDNPQNLERANPNKQCSSGSFQKYFIKINEAMGWEKKGYSHYFTSSSLRKFFSNTLQRLGIRDQFIRIMMGHKLDNVEQSYFKIDVKAMKDEYKNAVESLTFFKVIPTEVDITKNPEFIKMRDELNYLKRMEEGRKQIARNIQVGTDMAWEERQRKKKG
jgi:integrase